LKAVRIFCRPACGNRKGGKVGHDNSFFASLLSRG
jgi:methylphosphotriester-DNA--protein-cysteine methyltransferase